VRYHERRGQELVSHDPGRHVLGVIGAVPSGYSKGLELGEPCVRFIAGSVGESL